MTKQLTRQFVLADTFHKATMPHSEICIYLGVAGKVAKFKLDDKDEVRLYDPTTGELFCGPILPSEAGLFSENGQYYFYPAREDTVIPNKEKPVPTINVIQTRAENEITSLLSWHDTPNGVKAAQACFVECARKHGVLDDEEIQNALDDGMIETDEGTIIIYHSTQGN